MIRRIQKALIAISLLFPYCIYSMYVEIPWTKYSVKEFGKFTEPTWREKSEPSITGEVPLPGKPYGIYVDASCFSRKIRFYIKHHMLPKELVPFAQINLFNNQSIPTSFFPQDIATDIEYKDGELFLKKQIAGKEMLTHKIMPLIIIAHESLTPPEEKKPKKKKSNSFIHRLRHFELKQRSHSQEDKSLATISE